MASAHRPYDPGRSCRAASSLTADGRPIEAALPSTVYPGIALRVRTRAPRRASPRFVDRVTGRSSHAARSAAPRTMYPDPGREPAGARAAQISCSHPCYGPSPSWWPRGSRFVSRPGWDITRLRSLDVLLPLCLARHLQPLRRGLDGCRSGERRARRDADRGNLLKQGIEPQVLTLHSDPRRADDQLPNSSPTSGRSLSRPPGQRRQPFSEAQVQDPEVSPRLPWPTSALPPPSPSAGRSSPGTSRPPCRRSRCSPPMMSIITGTGFPC